MGIFILKADAQARLMKTTNYFRNSVMIRRPYLKMEWIEYVISNPIRTEIQSNGRIRYWAFISEMDKYLRVITEPDKKGLHEYIPRWEAAGAGV